MNTEPKGPQAARWRQRKFDLLRRFSLSNDLLPGTLTESYTRCGKPTYHCADPADRGNVAWTLTFMSDGKRRLERIPKPWVQAVAERVEAGRQLQDALRDILTANVELHWCSLASSNPNPDERAVAPGAQALRGAVTRWTGAFRLPVPNARLVDTDLLRGLPLEHFSRKRAIVVPCAPMIRGYAGTQAIDSRNLASRGGVIPIERTGLAVPLCVP